MQTESLSSEECDFGELFLGKEHVFRDGATAAAIGDVEVPIGGAKVGLICES